jgi:hypothetical protein
MNRIFDEIQDKSIDPDWSKKIARIVVRRKKQERKNKKILLSLIACFVFVFGLNITFKGANKLSWENEILSVFVEEQDEYVFSSEIDEFITEMF